MTGFIKEFDLCDKINNIYERNSDCFSVSSFFIFIRIPFDSQFVSNNILIAKVVKFAYRYFRQAVLHREELGKVFFNNLDFYSKSLNLKTSK